MLCGIIIIHLISQAACGFSIIAPATVCCFALDTCARAHAALNCGHNCKKWWWRCAAVFVGYFLAPAGQTHVCPAGAPLPINPGEVCDLSKVLPHNCKCCCTCAARCAPRRVELSQPSSTMFYTEHTNRRFGSNGRIRFCAKTFINCALAPAMTWPAYIALKGHRAFYSIIIRLKKAYFYKAARRILLVDLNKIIKFFYICCICAKMRTIYCSVLNHKTHYVVFKAKKRAAPIQESARF